MGPRIVSVQTNPDLSLTVAGSHGWRRLNDQLPSGARAGHRRGVGDLWTCRGTAGSAVTGAVLLDERRRLPKVSRPQRRQVPWGEDVGSGRSPGLEGDVAGVAAAGQSLLWHRLAGHWWRGRLDDGQLDRLGQDGTIGLEGVVL